MWFGIYYEEKGVNKGYLTFETNKHKLLNKINHVLNNKGKLKQVRVKGNLYTAEEFYRVLNGQEE